MRREFLAEVAGTFVLILFGCGVNAQVTLGGLSDSGGSPFGDFFSINIGWGVAVTMGIFVAGGITGAHLNPAVSIGLASVGKFPWSKVLPYIAAQLIGAFAASLIVYLTYYEAIATFDADRTLATAGIFATYPQEYLSNVPGGLFDQIIGTALLLGMVLAITDKQNVSPSANLWPPAVGAIVFMIGMSFGMNAGYAINPARDFGPRLFTYLAGWGGQVFTAGDGFWWIPIAGPIIGGIIGCWAYCFVIEQMHPESDGSENP